MAWWVEQQQVHGKIPGNSTIDLSEDKDGEEWKCECGSTNTGKFCGNCGKPKATKKQCPKCKAMNEPTDKFCSQCGTSLE